MEKYNHKEIEPKMREKWEKMDLFKAEDFSTREKKYVLIEFPYPSGAGLHVGHVRSYTALDIYCRKLRMEGTNVLYPIGWDAFGLPTENYAIKNKIHPRVATKKNIAIFKEQIKSLGISFDWSREINTTDTEYYKWTQWIFLKLFEQGLAYKASIPINWCPSCKIGLANEEVINGKCERCGAQTEMREKEQWMLKITEYAERLINDLDTVNYLEKIKTQQINWIGRSEGSTIKFSIFNSQFSIEVFTTRPDTLFGCSYVVVSPEHPMIFEAQLQIENIDAVVKYIDEAKKKSEMERTDASKEKTGIELKGLKAINPINGEQIPVWVSDYVLSDYGTGAVMAVPAHDQRDWEFAKKFNLKIVEVIKGGDISKGAFTGEGILMNSTIFDGINSSEAKEKIINWLVENKAGEKVVKYKLRDWVFSRQHYWGEPIPIIHCEKCGLVPVPENQLPIKLPDVEHYEPTDTGESPLAKITDWVNTTCPVCGGPAKRETDTMPNWAGSSWYFLRYMDVKNDNFLADMDKMKYWMPVDLYNGGMEHTTLHLLYSRFWNKFLFDAGIVPVSEPYAKRISHGMILAADGRKMSKSFGNVINPNDVVNEYGADALRVYEMFIGPYGETISWSAEGLKGAKRFLERVWNLYDKTSEESSSKEIEKELHKTIKKVSDDITDFKFNTAVAAMMSLIGLMAKENNISIADYNLFLTILSPFAPHMTDAMWGFINGEDVSIFQEMWPAYNSELIKEKTFSLIAQINGKMRDSLEVNIDISEDEAKKRTLSSPKVQKWIEGKEIKKVIYVEGKLVNIVV